MARVFAFRACAGCGAREGHRSGCPRRPKPHAMAAVRAAFLLRIPASRMMNGTKPPAPKTPPRPRPEGCASAKPPPGARAVVVPVPPDSGPRLADTDVALEGDEDTLDPIAVDNALFLTGDEDAVTWRVFRAYSGAAEATRRSGGARSAEDQAETDAWVDGVWARLVAGAPLRSALALGAGE